MRGRNHDLGIPGYHDDDNRAFDQYGETPETHNASSRRTITKCMMVSILVQDIGPLLQPRTPGRLLDFLINVATLPIGVLR